MRGGVARHPVVAAVALAGVPFVALGLGRFAYGLLLPSMRHDLGWSYADAGLVGGANALGYLIGAAAAARWIGRSGLAPAVIGATWLTAGSVVMVAVSGQIVWAVAMRMFAGFFGAVAFVAGGVAATHLRELGASHALTLYPAGAGAGMACSAALVGVFGASIHWVTGWVVVGALGLAVAAAVSKTATGFARREDGDGVVTAAPADALPVRSLLAAYGLWGLGYITYATFAVGYLRDRDVAAPLVSLFWLLVGASAMVGVFIWPRILERLQGGFPLAAPMLVVAASIMILLVNTDPAFVVVSAVLFGGSFLVAISGVSVIVRRDVRREAWAEAMGRLTAAFAVGQVAGPVLAGLSGDRADGLGAALGASAAVLVVGALVATRHGASAAGSAPNVPLPPAPSVSPRRPRLSVKDAS